MAERLRYKSIMQSETNQNPEHRILRLIDFLKSEKGVKGPFEVPITRQQIANMTGLRVETVIRSIKKMEKEGKVRIENKKVIR